MIPVVLLTAVNHEGPAGTPCKGPIGTKIGFIQSGVRMLGWLIAIAFLSRDIMYIYIYILYIHNSIYVSHEAPLILLLKKRHQINGFSATWPNNQW